MKNPGVPLVIAVCIVVTGAGFAAGKIRYLLPSNKLTSANFKAIQTNMTKSQIVNLIGQPDSCGILTNSSTFEGTQSVETCYWGNQNDTAMTPYAVVKFQSDIVESAESGNLR